MAYAKKPAKHAFLTIAEDLKADRLRGVLLLYGREQYLIRWAVEQMAARYIEPAARFMDLAVLEQPQHTAAEIIQAAESFPFLSQRKIVWVKDFRPLTSDSNQMMSPTDAQELIGYLQQANENTLLVFSGEEVDPKKVLGKALLELARCYEFTALDRKDLQAFITKRFRMAGAEIGLAEVRYLMDSTGYFNRDSQYDLYQLQQDIGKVVAHAQGQRICQQDIEATVCSDRDTFVFNMLDGILAGRKDQALTLATNILSGEESLYRTLGAMASQFEMLLSVKEMLLDGLSLGEISKALGANEFRIKKLIPYARRMETKQIRTMLTNLYEIDRSIKTGLLRPSLALELYIARV